MIVPKSSDADVRHEAYRRSVPLRKRPLLRNNRIGRMETTMHISSLFKRDISALIEKEPLAEGEYRLIPKAGSHYISLSPKWGNEVHLFELALEGHVVYVFKKMS